MKRFVGVLLLVIAFSAIVGGLVFMAGLKTACCIVASSLILSALLVAGAFMIVDA